MVTIRISDRNARPRTAAVLVAAAALILISSCASTVAGAARPVADGPGTRTTPAADPPRSDGQVSTATSGPESTRPETRESKTLESKALESKTMESRTIDSKTTEPDTTAKTPATKTPATKTPATKTTEIDPGPKGVPKPTEDHLRKKIGEDSGIAVKIDGVDTRVLSFAVTEIDPAMGKKCDDPDARPKGAALIGVKVTFIVPKAYRPNKDGVISFARESFAVKDAEGGFHNYTGSPAAKTCLSKGLLPSEPLQPGDSGTGWIVLDSAVRYGLVQFNLAGLDGINGWEWAIPGS